MQVQRSHSFQALVVGVGIYSHPLINDLPQTINDALSLAAILKNPAYCAYPPAQVHLLLREQATANNIFDKLHLFSVSNNAKNATTIIYFSGHGGRDVVSNDGYLLAHDTDPTDLMRTAISKAAFSNTLAAIQTGKVIIILDACYSNGAVFLKEGNNPSWIPGLPKTYYDVLKEGTGRVFIASSSYDQVSYTTTGDLSLFTKYLIDGLKGGAESKNGLIGVFDLFGYISDKMHSEAPHQQPFLSAKDLSMNIPIAFATNSKNNTSREDPSTGNARQIAQNLGLNDVYAGYEIGGRELLNRLNNFQKAEVSPHYRRLMEDIKFLRKYGDDQSRKADLHYMLDILNQLAQRFLGLEIEDLYNQGLTRETLSNGSEDTLKENTNEVAILPPYLRNLGYNVFANNNVQFILPPPLCKVPFGDFFMGCPPEDRDCVDALPRHKLSWLDTFEISPFPITVAEYLCAVKAKVVQPPKKPKNFGRGLQFTPWKTQITRLEHPVVCISWHEAIKYTSWLVSLTDMPWRLPTEAEWEKAARGTSELLYPWGNEWNTSYTNTREGARNATLPIGFYASDKSPYGVFDMAGNVAEWTATIFRKYPYKFDGRDSLKTPTRGKLIIRGGSWNNGSYFARTYHRLYDDPSSLEGNRGFRLAIGNDNIGK